MILGAKERLPNLKLGWWWAALLALVQHLPAPLWGAVPDRKVSGLSDGMTYTEVLKSWGPAGSKTQFESKREQVWHYGSVKVIFREGQVVNWDSRAAGLLKAEIMPAAPVAALQAEHSPEAEALLNEILREIPSEEDGKGSAGAMAPMASPGGGEPENLQRMMPIREREFPE